MEVVEDDREVLLTVEGPSSPYSPSPPAIHTASPPRPTTPPPPPLAHWPTVDGPLGLQLDAALTQARNFFYAGFFLLPWLWFVNCFYFWPVLRHRQSADPVLRTYIVRSGIGFLIYTSVLLVWALTFAIGGQQMFGSVWKNLAVYELADSFDLLGS